MPMSYLFLVGMFLVHGMAQSDVKPQPKVQEASQEYEILPAMDKTSASQASVDSSRSASQKATRKSHHRHHRHSPARQLYAYYVQPQKQAGQNMGQNSRILAMPTLTAPLVSQSYGAGAAQDQSLAAAQAQIAQLTSQLAAVSSALSQCQNMLTGEAEESAPEASEVIVAPLVAGQAQKAGEYVAAPQTSAVTPLPPAAMNAPYPYSYPASASAAAGVPQPYSPLSAVSGSSLLIAPPAPQAPRYTPSYAANQYPQFSSMGHLGAQPQYTYNQAPCNQKGFCAPSRVVLAPSRSSRSSSGSSRSSSSSSSSSSRSSVPSIPAPRRKSQAQITLAQPATTPAPAAATSARHTSSKHTSGRVASQLSMPVPRRVTTA